MRRRILSIMMIISLVLWLTTTVLRESGGTFNTNDVRSLPMRWGWHAGADRAGGGLPARIHVDLVHYFPTRVAGPNLVSPYGSNAPGVVGWVKGRFGGWRFYWQGYRLEHFPDEDVAPLGGYGVTGYDWIIELPDYAVFIAVSLLMILTATARYWCHDIQRRLGNGWCPGCGYDLRATPDCCPECGAVPKWSLL